MPLPEESQDDVRNITTKRLIIDLEKETVEDMDDYSVDDILSVAGILKPGDADEMLDHIKESREGWCPLGVRVQIPPTA